MSLGDFASLFTARRRRWANNNFHNDQPRGYIRRMLGATCAVALIVIGGYVVGSILERGEIPLGWFTLIGPNLIVVGLIWLGCEARGY